MAQFKISETNKTSFFTDNVHDRPNRNNQFGDKTVKARPRLDDEIAKTQYDLQLNFRNSNSEMINIMEDMDKVTQDFFSLTGIYYNMNDYVAEVDEPFMYSNNVEFDPGGSYVGEYFGSATSMNHVRAKQQYINRKIEEYFEKNPEQRGSKLGGFRDYSYYENARRNELAELEQEAAIGQKYNDGSTLSASIFGGGLAIFQDPLIIESLPVIAASGGSFASIMGIVRMAASEAVISGTYEAVIQSKVVSYNQRLGSDYGWKEASAAIALAAGGGALATAALGGTIKTFFNGYSKILRATPNGKAKAIAQEIDKLIDEAPILDDAYATKVMDYINKNIQTFNTAEKAQFLETIIENTPRGVTPTVKTAQQVLEGDELIDTTNPLESTPRGKQEHIERVQNAGEGLLSGENKLNDETRTPIDYTKNFDNNSNVIREVRLDPDEIEVEPDVFQFKTEEIDPQTGVSPKLKGITEWDQDAANVVMVFEYADGRKVIADGHQRLALAKRIKAMGKQKPYLLATIRREVDGHTPEETMVAAMMLNVHQGTASAADVAKILKIKPDYVQAIKGKISPRSVLWENARGLSKLSPEAWQYYLNNNVPDKIAAIVGDLVEDPDLHIQVIDFITKNNFANEQQIRLAIQDVISQGVSTREVQDLFGTQTIKELLIKERAEILDKAIKELKKDKNIAGFLVNNEAKILKKGKNKLDSDFNKKALEESALAIEKIIKLANMKGAISDELNIAAKLFKDGNKQEAVQSFKEAITTAIKNGDLDRVTPGRVERTALSEGYTQEQPNIPKETEANKNLKNSENVHDGKQQYDQEYGSVENTINDIRVANKLDTPKEPAKVEIQSKTLAEISELPDDVLKNQADELIDHPEIVRLRELSLSKETTIKRAGGTFDENWQQQRGWQQVVDDLYGEGAAVQNKELTVFIGLPASGKSTLAAAQQKELGAIIIDSDFVKEHPNFAKDYDKGNGAGALHEESKAIQELIIDRAFNNGDNIIVPIVGSGGKSIEKYIDLAKAYGYSLVVKYVEVDEATAITRNVKRIYNDGRFVDPQYIKDAYKGAIANYTKGKEKADGYEKINLEGARPVTKEIGGKAQTNGGSRQPDGGQAYSKSETEEIEGIFAKLDPQYQVMTGVDADGNVVMQSANDVLLDLNKDKKAIDFLEGCPGLK